MGLTRAEAIARVSLWCDATAYPEVSTTDIGTVVDQFSRFSSWTASTAYAVGDRIVPTTPNGRVYEARRAGTSDTTEPDWPTAPWTQYQGWIYSEGTSDPELMWVDAGPANVERYDVRSAARQVWLIKASRVVGEIDSKDGSADVKLSQLRTHCLEQAEKFRPMVIV
jgi:hypothetical protein